jgi:hypothetical protein
MSCVILTTDEFDEWFAALSEAERIDIKVIVGLLEDRGVTLGYPYSSALHGSGYGHMRELRIQHRGRPIRVLYAFDPQRNVILLVGGDKGSDDRWYARHIPLADKLYGQHLESLKEAGHGKLVRRARQKDDESKSKKNRRR